MAIKITPEMVKQAYYFGKKVYSGELSTYQAKQEISAVSGMDVGSALVYISVLLEMLHGEEYHRTINTFATDYYLVNIKLDYGIEILRKAINAVDLHTKYYKTLGRGSLPSVERIVREFRDEYAI